MLQSLSNDVEIGQKIRKLYNGSGQKTSQKEQLAEPHFLEIRHLPLAETLMVIETNFSPIKIAFPLPRNK